MNVGNVQILESNEIIPSNTFLSSRSTSIITNRLEIIEIVRITYSSGKMRRVINGRRKKRGGGGGKKERKKEKRVGREKDEREISRGTWPCKTAQHSIRFKLAFTPRRGNNGSGFFFLFYRTIECSLTYQASVGPEHLAHRFVLDYFANDRE